MFFCLPSVSKNLTSESPDTSPIGWLTNKYFRKIIFTVTFLGILKKIIEI